MNKEILKELCFAFGSTGREAGVAAIVKKYLDNLDLDVKIDALGNVIVQAGEPGTAATVFCTGMDQAGWVAEHLDKRGMLHLKSVPLESKLGDGWGIDNESRRYLVSRSDDGKSTLAEPLAKDSAGMGTFIVPEPVFEESEDFVYAGALSDRAGAALLLDAAMEHPRSAAFVFYTGRHLKYTGITAALQPLEIERVYLIESVPADYGNESCSSGEGPLLFLRTRRSIAPSLWVKEVEQKTNGLGIKLQKKVMLEQESAADVLSRSGIPCAVLGVGVRYYGSRVERVSVQDYQGLSKLLVEILKGDDKS